MEEKNKEGWKPIETAPVNKIVDIWVVPPSKADEFTPYRNKISSSGRVPDAIRRQMLGAWVAKNGRYVTGRWFFDEDGDVCIDIDDSSEYAFRATHWRDVPEPPERGKGA